MIAYQNLAIFVDLKYYLVGSVAHLVDVGGLPVHFISPFRMFVYCTYSIQDLGGEVM